MNRDLCMTKKCVVTHTDYFLNFKMALYSSALVMNFLGRKLF